MVEEYEYFMDLFCASDEDDREEPVAKFLEANLPRNIKLQKYDENYVSEEVCGVPFVVVSAKTPKNYNMMVLANKLYYDERKPYVIIDVDEEDAFIETAENLFPNFWGNKDSALSDAELYFSTFYFSAPKGKIDIDSQFDIKGNGIGLIVEALEKDWLLR